MRVRWTLRAANDLRDLSRYIADFNPNIAVETRNRIRKSVKRLEKYPKSGRVIPEYDDAAIREIIVGRFRVWYRVAGRFVDIFTIRGGQQLSPDNISEIEKA
ncbi:type II toxin-antitoxin system RelE/ParE family toxin [bacterium]|nr:type II toxin-antitoxin system RelE/ParE family toxin [bacterium]